MVSLKVEATSIVESCVGLQNDSAAVPYTRSIIVEGTNVESLV